MDLAIVNARVIPMVDGARVLKNATIVVEGDTITDIGQSNSISVPTGAYRIDGAGKIVLPGLINAHSHI